jgi:protocatechuate 3,4-dioxygenase beta subunit
MDHLARRSVLAGGLALGLTGARAQESLPPTPMIELGPFYPVIRPVDTDADLTRIAGRSGRAEGEVIQLIGKMVDRRGRPITNGRVELWQCNAAGRYAHPADPNPAPLDPEFQGFAQLATDAQGEFRVTTIKPAAYPAGRDWMRAPHIHMDAQGNSYRSSLQMMFDDPLLTQDRVLTDFSAEELARVLAQPLDPGTDGTARFAWTIVMREG